MRHAATFEYLGSALRAAAFTAAATAIAYAMDGAYSLASQSMAYLLAVVVSAFRIGRRDSILTAVFGVAALNYFFVPPRHTFEVENADYLATLAALLVVSLVVSGLAARLKAETAQVRLSERRARELHALAESLASAADERQLLAHGVSAIGAAFTGPCCVLLPDAGGRLDCAQRTGDIGFDPDAAKWAFEHAETMGPGTRFWPDLPNWYMPLSAGGAPLGVLVISVPRSEAVDVAQELQHLEALGRQTGLALQRARLSEQARAATLEVQAAAMRNALLASISHDLRTPLAVVLGSATTLGEQRERLSEEQQRSLLRTIEDETRQMTAMVENVLQLARLSSGRLALRCDWESLEEIVGSVVGRLKGRGDDARIKARVPAGLPLLRVDAVLLAQVLANLLENALRHAPPGDSVEVEVVREETEVSVAVMDRGPGFGDLNPEKLFAGYRPDAGTPDRRGPGLGLAICRSIVELHGGRIEARNREGGGAVFRFVLPITETAPAAHDRHA